MAILKELDLPQYKQSLRKAVSFLNNLDYSPVKTKYNAKGDWDAICLLYTSPSPRDRISSRMPSSA